MVRRTLSAEHNFDGMRITQGASSKRLEAEEARG